MQQTMLVKNITKNSAIVQAPAKINLMLEVLNKREDGFHNINSIFQAISLYDEISFEKLEEPGFQLEIENKNLPNDQSNLIFKAYELMKRKFQLTDGLKVSLKKNIPVSAGLGGGSSDAAATVDVINRLYGLGLSTGEMAEISEEIGSDIPFFFSSGQAVVTGTGNVVKDIHLPIDYWVVLVEPSRGFSTAKMYASLKRDLTYSKNPFNLASYSTVKDYLSLKVMIDKLKETGNDFEAFALENYPELNKIRAFLLKQGALIVRMSGSGSVFFGIFESPPDVNNWTKLVGVDWQFCTVKPITLPVQNI